MNKAIFTIDGGLYVEGAHVPSNRWNGWAKPIFPLESVQVIASWLVDNNADYEQGGIVVMLDGVPHWKEINDEGKTVIYPCLECVVNGEKFFDIGSYGWVWDDVTIPTLDTWDDEGETYDYWLGEIKACAYKSAGVLDMIGGK